MGFAAKIPLILGPKRIGLQRPKLLEHLRGAAGELLGGMKRFVFFFLFFSFFSHHLGSPKASAGQIILHLLPFVTLSDLTSRDRVHIFGFHFLDRISGFQRVHVGSRMAPT